MLSFAGEVRSNSLATFSNRILHIAAADQQKLTCCVDTGYRLEDLPSAIKTDSEEETKRERERERERVKVIGVVGMHWGRWCLCQYFEYIYKHIRRKWKNRIIQIRWIYFDVKQTFIVSVLITFIRTLISAMDAYRDNRSK